MKWLELKEAEIGSGAIFLFGCEQAESAYQLKRRLKEQRPNAVILYAGAVSKIREYQAAHWVKVYHNYGAKEFHNYLTTGYRKNFFHTALDSLQSALQCFAKQHGFMPAEVVLVRAF